MSNCEVINTPEDEIQYREYKILLKPDRFTGPQAFRDFWRAIEKSAKKFDLKLEPAENAFENQIREVLFFDTPQFALYNNHFIVRLRTFYHDGWPVGIPELTVKFRHPEFKEAAAVDVRPAVPGGLARIKFKEELLPLRTELGGMRSVFSHNCVLASSREVLNVAVKDFEAFFPAIGGIQLAPDDQISLVNDVAVEEVQVDVGRLHFGHGFNGKATIAVWRDRRLEKPLCGEFAFQCKFNSAKELHKSSLAKADEFYRACQLDAFEWLTLGSTKTAMVYSISGNTPNNRE